MAVCSHDVKVVVHDRRFFIDFNFVCGDSGEYIEGITYQVIYSLVHGKHDSANFESLHYSIHKLHLSKCNLFSLCLLYKSIFLLLLLCRAVTMKLKHIWVCRL